MPRVDFAPDVDGFAFANNWTFDATEKDEIREIVHVALPAAAALLSPVLLAAGPLIVSIVAPVVGLAAPLLALGWPVLAAMTPQLSEAMVTAIVDQIAKGDGKDNLCGGMTAAALDYHRLGWLPPRGAANPERAGGGFEAWLRDRIWDGQLESHLDNTPRVIAWKAVASFFGDWGHDWLRDQTRAELARIEAELNAGRAAPIGAVWNDGKDIGDMGHILVAYELEWFSPDQCALTVYDNEHPNAPRYFDIDLGQSPAMIRVRGGRGSDGIFLASVRPRVPCPAVILSTPLTLSPVGFIVQDDPLEAQFAVANIGFGDAREIAGGLRSGGHVSAPAMAYLLPATMDVIAVGAQDTLDILTTSLPAGAYVFEPVALAWSELLQRRVVRVLPQSDATVPATCALRVNPRAAIRLPRPSSGFGCAKMLVEGQSVTLQVDLSPFVARGVQSVAWTVTGALTMTGTGPTLTIAALPPSPGRCDVTVRITLADQTESHGSTRIGGVTPAQADRVQRMCELAHLVSRIPFTKRFDPKINPGRDRNATVQKTSTPDPYRVAEDMQRALAVFLKRQ